MISECSGRIGYFNSTFLVLPTIHTQKKQGRFQSGLRKFWTSASYTCKLPGNYTKKNNTDTNPESFPLHLNCHWIRTLTNPQAPRHPHWTLKWLWCRKHENTVWVHTHVMKAPPKTLANQKSIPAILNVHECWDPGIFTGLKGKEKYETEAKVAVKRTSWCFFWETTGQEIYKAMTTHSRNWECFNAGL